MLEREKLKHIFGSFQFLFLAYLNVNSLYNMNALTSPGPGNSWAADSFKSRTGYGRFEPLGLHYNAYIMLYCKKVGGTGL